MSRKGPRDGHPGITALLQDGVYVSKDDVCFCNATLFESLDYKSDAGSVVKKTSFRIRYAFSKFV